MHGEAGRAVDAEVVDLLQDGFARPRLVVLVRREGRPVPRRRDELARAEAVGGEGSRRAEVRDLARRVARAPDLHGHALGGPVGGLQPPPCLRHGKRELASAVALDLEPRVPREIGEVGDAVEHGSAPLQAEPVALGPHRERAGQGQDHHLVRAGVDRARGAGGEPQDPQSGERPARDRGRDVNGVRPMGDAARREVQARLSRGQAWPPLRADRAWRPSS